MGKSGVNKGGKMPMKNAPMKKMPMKKGAKKY